MKHFAILLLTLLSSLAVVAQSNVTRCISKVETDNTTSYSVYSENRDPRTHKVVKASKVMVVSAANAKKVIEAFRRDREKSVQYTETNGRVYTVVFSGGGMRSAYTLLLQNNGRWLLTIEERSTGENRHGRQAYVPSYTTELDRAFAEAALTFECAQQQAMQQINDIYTVIYTL